MFKLDERHGSADESVTSVALSVCVCVCAPGRRGRRLRLDAERSAHLQLGEPRKVGAKLQRTHGERGGSDPAARPRRRELQSNPGEESRACPAPASALGPPGPPATMRADFALVLTAVLLLDAFWVRFRRFLRAELRVRGASS